MNILKMNEELSAFEIFVFWVFRTHKYQMIWRYQTSKGKISRYFQTKMFGHIVAKHAQAA